MLLCNLLYISISRRTPVLPECPDLAEFYFNLDVKCCVRVCCVCMGVCVFGGVDLRVCVCVCVGVIVGV